MDYIHYVIFGPWQGVFSIILILIGLFLCVAPYLTHPEIAFSSYAKRGIRSMFGIVFIIAGLVGLGVLFFLANEKITAQQYQTLQAQAQQVPAAKQLIKSHLQDHKIISRYDYFILRKKLEQNKKTVLEQQMRNW